MTNNVRTVSNEQLQEGINGWAWTPFAALLRPDGTRIKAVPALQRDKLTNKSYPKLQCVANKATGAGVSFLLNLRAGYTPATGAPADMVAAIKGIDPRNPDGTNSAYLLMKNKYQITISFNSELDSHTDVLDNLYPAWRLVKAGQAVQIRRGIMLDIFGLKLATDDKGTPLMKDLNDPKTGKASGIKGFLYNWSIINILAIAIDQEVSAESTSIGSSRPAINVAAAMAAAGISVTMDEAFGGGQPDQAPASRAAAPAVTLAPADYAKAVRSAGHKVTAVQAAKLMAGDYPTVEGLLEEIEAGSTIEELIAAVA